VTRYKTKHSIADFIIKKESSAFLSTDENPYNIIFQKLNNIL